MDTAVRAGAVLALQCGDGSWLYQAWQFDEAGGVRDVLVPTLEALRSMDRWQAACWLVSPHPDLGGSSPRQALREGASFCPALVVQLATHDTNPR